MTITRTTPLDQLPEFLTPAEVKTFLGLSRATTYELLRRGELPSVRFGRLLRIPRTALTQRA